MQPHIVEEEKIIILQISPIDFYQIRPTRLLMELRDGKMKYKLPDDWNKALATIGGNE